MEGYKGVERRLQIIQCGNRMKNIEDKMDTKFNSIDRKFVRIDDKLNNINEKLDTTLKILLGNGKLGLIPKVQILWGSSIFIIITLVGVIVRLLL